MARTSAERFVVTATFEATRPLHVGGYGESFETDLPLARDGAGRLYVPGTSLAGSFRAWWRRAFGDPATDRLWGFIAANNGQASFVLVEDAEVILPRSAVTEIRDGVGIDRRRGTAAENIKFDRAVLPKGTTIALTMCIDIGPSEFADAGDTTAARLGHFLEALENGRIRLGAAQTRGLGAIALAGDSLRVSRQPIGTRNGMLNALRERLYSVAGANAPSLPIAALKGLAADCKPAAERCLSIELHWRAQDPVMVSAGFDGFAVDMVPLASRDGNHVRLVLPGSSIKGALRAQAERIMRTVLGRRDCDDARVTTKDFLDQVRVPLVDALFGWAPKAREDGLHSRPLRTPKLGRGALAVGDCYAESAIDPSHWDDVLEAKDDKALQDALTGSGLTGWDQADHVAVDRWTGGAADGFLYSILEPSECAWEPIPLDIDLARFGDACEAKAALALLLLTLDDLARGRITLGFAGNRGLGSVAVNRLTFDATNLDPDNDADLVSALAGGSEIEADGGVVTRLPEPLKACLVRAWREAHQTLRAEERSR